MEKLLTKLRELGVHIPQDASNWDDAQLTNYAKVLCPYTMTVETVQDAEASHMAYTRKDKSGDVVYSTSAPKAAYGLLLLQIEKGVYKAGDTSYKADAMRFRATNK